MSTGLVSCASTYPPVMLILRPIKCVQSTAPMQHIPLVDIPQHCQSPPLQYSTRLVTLFDILAFGNHCVKPE
jgi:hypothetical protein